MTELKQTIRYCKAPDGRAIAWSTMGSGPPIVMVRDFGHLEYEYLHSIAFGPLGAAWGGHLVIRYDLLGTGLSGRSDEVFSLEGAVDQLGQVVKAASVEPFTLACSGGSGCLAAIIYAARHPERVNGLVIQGGYARGLMRRDPTPEQIGSREAMLAASLGGWNDPAFRILNAYQMYPAGSKEEIETVAAFMYESMSANYWVGYLRAVVEIDVSDAARQIKCPVLILHSQDDPRIPFEEARRMASLIDNARLVPLSSRNNTTMPSEPAFAEAVDTIRQFLAEVSGTARGPGLLPHLTPREHQVLELIAQGKDNLQIAAHLNLSEKTVRNHITPIFDKLQVENRSQAIVKARNAGMGKR